MSEDDCPVYTDLGNEEPKSLDPDLDLVVGVALDDNSDRIEIQLKFVQTRHLPAIFSERFLPSIQAMVAEERLKL